MEEIDPCLIAVSVSDHHLGISCGIISGLAPLLRRLSVEAMAVMTSKFLLPLALIALFAPSAIAQVKLDQNELLQELYRKDVEMIKARRTLQIADLRGTDPRSKAALEYKKASQALLSGQRFIDKAFQQIIDLVPQDESLTIFKSQYDGAFRNNTRTVQIKELDRMDGREIMIDSIGVETNFIRLKNLVVGKDQFEGKYISAKVVCDGEYRIKTGLIFRSKNAYQVTEFRLGKGDKNYAELSMSPRKAKCSVSVESKSGGKATFSFVNEDEVLNEDLRSMSRSFEVCGLPEYSGTDTTRQFFLTDRLNSFSCPQVMEDYRTLEDPIDGLQEKARALLGVELPIEMIAKRDPYFPLDFSLAPKLDGIYVSYLVFRLDYYGAVIERLIRHHAERGTQIKIVVADVITLAKDRQALDQLQFDFPQNVSVKYSRVGGGAIKSLPDWINQFHRSIHMKKFIAYSRSDPEANIAVIGGRNIHDGFIFKTASNLTSFPSLVQYGKGKGTDELFCRWTDFELSIRDQAVVRTLIGQFHTVFDNDNNGQLYRNYSINRKNGRVVGNEFFTNDKPMVRHFISVPYRDGQELEKYVGGLIDSAQKEIVISTPYFNLTNTLARSFANAIKRGVNIKLVTRINLEGDTPVSPLLEAVNKKAINKFYKQFEIYEFNSPSDILHSKIILVDGKLSSIGSVNLNQRSFKHDIENVMLVYSPEFNQKMMKIVEGYIKTSRKVDAHVNEKIFPRIIVRIFRSLL